MATQRKNARLRIRRDEAPDRLTLQLPADLSRRFGVHAEMLGISKSALFAELVRAGCRRFVIQDHDRQTARDEDQEVA